jgi:hypothetical protein
MTGTTMHRTTQRTARSVRRGSMTVSLLLAFLGAGCGGPPAEPPPVPSAPAVTDPPSTRRVFSEEADARGLVFTSVNGQQRGHLTILESLGAGVALIDYDADGDDDIVAVGGGDFTGAGVQPCGVPDAVFRNDGRGHFDTVTVVAHAGGGGFYAHGVNVGDYDADGLPDLLVTGYDGIALLHNLGDGTFRQVPAAEHGIPADGWLTSSAWLDVDGDGHLDLYLVRYCDWSPENDPRCEIQGHRDVCPPAQFAGVDDRLLLGDGAGGFRDTGGTSGLVSGGKGLGVIAADLDLDGDTDLFVANDTTPNFLYRNAAGGRLEECGLLAGAALGPTGEPEGSMGVDAGDANLDGLPDLWVANFENQSFGLLRNFGDCIFENVSAVTGITAVGAVYVGFGTMFLDVDLDGAEDLFVTNGHVMRFPTQSSLRQRPLLFLNRGGRRMENAAARAGPYFAADHMGRGAAAGDLDGDGDEDVVVSHMNEPLALLVNETPRQAGTVTVRLIGTMAHRDAIGASAVLETTARRMLRLVKGGGSYLSSSSRRLVWALAADERPRRLLVRWPGGAETVTPLDTTPGFGEAEPEESILIVRQGAPGEPLPVAGSRWERPAR